MHGTRKAAAAITAALAAALLTACANTSAPAAVAASATLGAKISPVPLTQVQRDITTLYARTPGIATFVISDVEYTAATLHKVLSVCASGAAASDENALQSDKIMACAPLIYFFYSYGKRDQASGAGNVASELYDYAVTTITGPVSTQQALSNLLRSWGVPVSATTAAPLALTGTARLEATLVAAARTVLDSSRGVHIDVTAAAKTAKQVQQASFDCGTSSAAETLSDGGAVGRLRVTAEAVYFSGNAAGLAEFFGLSKKAAARVGSDWVSAKAGTSQYASLAAGSLIASIPASILPASNEVTVTSTTAQGGVPVYQLTWKSFVSNASTPIEEILDLAVTGDHAPVSETSKTATASQVDRFSNWGSAPAVTAPAHAIPFTTAFAG